MPKILIVDDEEPLRLSLSYALGREGFAVTTAADGPSALAAAREELDAIVLDVMLPGVDGLEICRRIREWSDVPIVMLTAKDHATDKVSGLDIGADDYVTKPFNTRELIARVRAAMRRRERVSRLLEQDRQIVTRLEELAAALGPGDGRESGVRGRLHGGRVSVDLDRSLVSVDGSDVKVSPDELRLLAMLVAARGRVVTRTELAQAMYARAAPDTMVRLEACVRTLMQKIELDAAAPVHIRTIPGIGYAYEPA